MSKYRSFIFENYDYDKPSKTLVLNYSLDGQVSFQEIYTFDFEHKEYDEHTLDKAFQQLFFMAGVSYYKTYIPENIEVKSGTITPSEAEFYAKTWRKGLGEFFYVNNLDPNTKVSIPSNIEETGSELNHNGTGFLVAIGGGKDSLVSLEILRNNSAETIETWSLNHKDQLEPLANRTGTKHYFVGRQWDRKLNDPDALPGSTNGHIPISAIFACAGVVVAILAGRRDVVMSNERSADEPTLKYRGTDINHQYSKSSEFESDFQSQLAKHYGDRIRYYSLLRPLSEIQIAKLFGGEIFEKYKDVFSSCNRAFVHASDKIFWDGECPKCAFVYLILSNYVNHVELDKLMNGNVLLKPQLEETYKELLGITHNKPLECVGEINESRWAMDNRKADYPELEKYQYPPVGDNEVFYLAESKMPADVREIVIPFFEQNALQK